MGYYLLQRRNPHGPHFYATRRNAITLIVLHITAGLQDLDMRGADHSAEGTARYAATTSRPVSWHKGVDSDSVIDLLPDNYTAFHCRGFNSRGLGLEISKTTTDWDSAPTRWVHATLANAAIVCRTWEKRHRIPQRLLTRTQAARGERGYLYHSTADPSRRSDPGANFPIRMLWSLIRGATPQSWTEESSMAGIIVPDSLNHEVRIVQRALDYVAVKEGESFRRDGELGVMVDSDWGEKTTKALVWARKLLKWWPHDAQEFDPWLMDRIRDYAAHQGDDPYLAF